MSAQLQQLPPAYQQAQRALERELAQEHFAPGNAALGSFDQMTFGVPLGFYHLAAGTAHGLGELIQGQYEQATRELAPAALLVALYAGGKGARYVAEARGGGARLSLPELRLEVLRRVAWRVSERLGVEGLGELARYIRASREAAVFVGAGGEPAAVALYEAKGNVAKAQAWLSEARPERPGAPEPRAAPGGVLGGVASLVDEAAGLSAEVLEAKLREAELEASGPRLPADVALLKKLHATLSAPPPGVPEGYALWEDYRAYRQRRLAELEQGAGHERPAAVGSLRADARGVRPRAGLRARHGGTAARGRPPAAGAAPVAQGLQPAAHRGARGRVQAGRARHPLRGRARHRGAAPRGPASSRGDLQLQEPLPRAA